MDRRAKGRIRAWVGAAVLLAVAGPGTSPADAGKRVGMVGAVCPAEASNKQIDADGVKDVCAAREPPSCVAPKRLVTDASGQSDRCLAEGAPTTGAGDKPSCPPALELKVRAGEDSCERVAKPVCPSGFHLSQRAKEDVCEH
jgi:hypothetical protein